MYSSPTARPLPSAQLEITLSGDTDRCDVMVRGDLDLATVDQLRSAFSGCLALGSRLVVVDVSGLGFVAVSGLNVLVDAHQALAASGARLMLARPTPLVQRVLRLTGLDTVLVVHGEQLIDTIADRHSGMSVTAESDRSRRRP